MVPAPWRHTASLALALALADVGPFASGWRRAGEEPPAVRSIQTLDLAGHTGVRGGRAARGQRLGRQVLTAREPVPVEPAKLIRYRCRFTMPESFADWAGDELEAAWTHDGLSGTQPVSGRFAVLVSGQPRLHLVHLGGGEFRFEGWSEERTRQVDPDGPARQVTFCGRRGWSRHETSRPLRQGT